MQCLHKGNVIRLPQNDLTSITPFVEVRKLPTQQQHRSIGCVRSRQNVLCIEREGYAVRHTAYCTTQAVYSDQCMPLQVTSHPLIMSCKGEKAIVVTKMMSRNRHRNAVLFEGRTEHRCGWGVHTCHATQQGDLTRHDISIC